jgi:hypothetical protein
MNDSVTDYAHSSNQRLASQTINQHISRVSL